MMSRVQKNMYLSRPMTMLLLLMINIVFVCNTQEVNSDVSERVLSRKKRYLVFPENSGFSVVYCLTLGTYTPSQIFTYGATLGIGFELPTDTEKYLAAISPTALHRKDRRDVYNKLQVVLDSRGMDGRTCILRAVCEAASRTEQGSFLDSLLRTIFTFPLSEGENDKEEHSEFDEAQWHGWTRSNCSKMYPACLESLFGLAFNHFDPFYVK